MTLHQVFFTSDFLFIARGNKLPYSLKDEQAITKLPKILDPYSSKQTRLSSFCSTVGENQFVTQSRFLMLCIVSVWREQKAWIEGWNGVGKHHSHVEMIITFLRCIHLIFFLAFETKNYAPRIYQAKNELFWRISM